ncbi:MAG: hypothetical protein P1U42_06435 [Phycisphaerales bacterium]|nr:hypothetical protein [Phycisphaerales bacterium]
MNQTTQINWWVDHTGSTHTNCAPGESHPDSIAAGKVFLDSKAGVITHLYNKPASPSMVSHELLDVLHKRFPGTRWWVKDISHQDIKQHQAAS